MNTIKFLGIGLMLLTLGASHESAVALDAQSSTMQTINNTITHLESALQGLNANELEAAQEHMKAAGQSSKNIIGGSVEVKAHRGSSVITNARRQIKEGNIEGAVVSLKEAIGIFNSLRQSSKSGGRGGLN